MSTAHPRHTKKGRRAGGRREEPAPSRLTATLRAFWIPLALTVGLMVLSTLERVQVNPALVRSFWGAAAVLMGWQAWLFLRARQTGTVPALIRMGPKPQHYIQAIVQLSVFAYWGWFWRPVYDFAWLLAAQLVFAYAFDMLLQWTRRNSYVLGFGPFPIIFSINLFLWFRDDWFFLQFLMIGVGFLGKEFVRWHREGRFTHVFNPSAFSLGLFSVVLILTNASDLTWGQEIATTLSAGPHIYLFLFLTGLIVMYFFSITLVAGSAAIVLFGLSALYSWWAGIPYFIDSEIPTAVFLGLHLLVTDPSTSPRTPLGKTIFGGLYGLGVYVLYALLGAIGVPTFYDKLLCVPLLNLSVRWIDHLVQSVRSAPGLDALGFLRASRGANLAHMGVWILFFGSMMMLGRTDGRHVGDSVPFWAQACEEGRRNACERLVQIEYAYCADSSGWACNEVGRHFMEGRIVEADPDLALGYFARACELRFQAGCLNVLEPDRMVQADPRILDLRLLLRERGPNLMEMPEAELFGRACEHDWTFACETLVSRSL